jgi:5-methylthioadenosine/S-adenosylhomocysteine deaminase
MNLHHNLVHAVQGGDVSLTIVDGQVVTEDGRLANADLRTLIQLVNEATPQLLERRDQWVRESGGAVRRAAG